MLGNLDKAVKISGWTKFRLLFCKTLCCYDFNINKGHRYMSLLYCKQLKNELYIIKEKVYIDGKLAIVH